MEPTKRKLLLIIISAVLILLAFLIIFLLKNNQSNTANSTTSTPAGTITPTNQTDDPALQKALDAGKSLSNNKCSGTGPVTLTHLPMQPEDFSILIPYGLMVGGHVTPIDHQYFAPKDQKSPRDAYEVFAIADGTITDIGPRVRVNPDDPNDKFQEYRLVITYTCTFFSYFDLVTSLSPDLKAEYERVKNSDGYAGSINFPVKSGQLIGRIGGQTLDFAVWDTEKPLTGFIVPEHYASENWKLYTANPFDYFTPELRDLMISRDPRTVEPIEGKIDYDIDGKLIGTWFVEGTNGYGGTNRQAYWDTHLSVAPDHFDPSKYIISMGSFNNEAKQFTHASADFAPQNIGVESGMVKVDLAQFGYSDAQGKSWDRMSVVKGPKLQAITNSTIGCVLFQLVEARKLQFEAFPGKKCSQVAGFTDSVKVYER